MMFDLSRPQSMMDRFLRHLGLIENAQEMEVAAETMYNLAGLADDEFRRRFPAEHACWEAQLIEQEATDDHGTE